jgi:N-hydroxyarylamine O-acetyltransferase
MPMTDSINLDAYFDRIDWRGGTDPSFETLAGLLRAHVLHIPFENFDVLLGRGVRLDLDSIQSKLVDARRGGYCFEHATLFGAVLEQLGFETARHTARVILFEPARAAPRAHMFLTVRLPEGTFVADPGFGLFTSRVPIPLVDGAKARGDYETHWMVRDGERWILRAQLGDEPVDAWVTTLEEDNPVDFEMGSHFTATHPASPFVNRIMISALTEEGRVTLMNQDAKIWQANRANPAKLADRSALRAFLIKYFGFDLPEVEDLRVPTIPEWNSASQAAA